MGKLQGVGKALKGKDTSVFKQSISEKDTLTRGWGGDKRTFSTGLSRTEDPYHEHAQVSISGFSFGHVPVTHIQGRAEYTRPRTARIGKYKGSKYTRDSSYDISFRPHLFPGTHVKTKRVENGQLTDLKSQHYWRPFSTRTITLMGIGEQGEEAKNHKGWYYRTVKGKQQRVKHPYIYHRRTA